MAVRGRCGWMALLALAAASCAGPPGTAPDADRTRAPGAQGPAGATASAWPRHHLVVLDERPARRTPPIAVPFDFDELVPSWNVSAPAGAGFRVRVRVARDGAAWSPWLDIGGWGADAGPTRRTAFAGGRVEVDTFRSAAALNRAQLEVLPFPDTAQIAIERLALCFSDMDGGRPPDAEPSLGELSLDVPFLSQRTAAEAIAGRVCSPTALTMVMAHHGVDRPLDEVAARAYDALHDIYGNWSRAVQVAFSYGIEGWVTRFSDWAAVERHLVEHGPLIISIGVGEGELTGAPYEATPGHLIVLRGFDAAGNVRANDPAAGTEAAGRLTYSRREIERVWMKRGGTAYALVSD